MNVLFDQLLDSTRQPEFEAAMSTMLQGLDTENALRPVPETMHEREEEENADVNSSSEESETIGEGMLPWYART